MNPGGLYGKATPHNFPTVNDYRYPVVAEGLKVLGFVNRLSRGVMRVENELQENGNGKPEFRLDLVTAFLAIEHISKDSELEAKAEENEGLNDGLKERETELLQNPLVL